MEWLYWIGFLVLIGLLFGRKKRKGRKSSKAQRKATPPTPRNTGSEDGDTKKKGTFTLARITVPKVPETFASKVAAEEFMKKCETLAEILEQERKRLDEWYFGKDDGTERQHDASSTRYGALDEKIGDLACQVDDIINEVEYVPYAWQINFDVEEYLPNEDIDLQYRLFTKKEMLAFLKKHPDCDEDDFDAVTLAESPETRPEGFEEFIQWKKDIDTVTTIDEYIEMTRRAIDQAPKAMGIRFREGDSLHDHARAHFRGRLGVNQATFNALEARGVLIPEHLDRVNFDDLAKVKGVGPKTIEKLRHKADQASRKRAPEATPAALP